ncbi:MAG: Hpt domain-containing protein [Roseovarius sp.]
MVQPVRDIPLIDWSRCVELREEVGREDFAEVVELFLAEAGADLAALDPSLPPAALRAALHGLKGSALNLGFAAFADLCREFEQASRHDGLAKKALQTCFDASKAELEAALTRAAVA